jgi:hypothetical protein
MAFDAGQGGDEIVAQSDLLAAAWIDDHTIQAEAAVVSNSGLILSVGGVDTGRGVEG